MRALAFVGVAIPSATEPCWILNKDSRTFSGLEQKLQREPSNEEVAEALEISIE